MDWIVLLSAVATALLCFCVAVASLAEVKFKKNWIDAAVHAAVGCIFLSFVYACGFGVMECLDRIFPR